MGGRKAGVPDHVQALTLQEVQDHWQRYYKPTNAVLVIAGAVDLVATRKMVSQHFEKLASGEKVPAPQEPGQATPGPIHEVKVKPLGKQGKSEVCLAYRAPAPTSGLYAPYLVLVARMVANASKLKSGEGRFPVYCPLFDDPAVLSVTSPALSGEAVAQSEKRLKAFVAETIEPKFDPKDIDAMSSMFGSMLGISEIADELLAPNPYFAAFSLGRRYQLGLTPAALKEALAKLRDEDLRRAAKDLFGPDRCAGVVVTVKGQ